MKQISVLFILFLTYSFLGWFMEVCVALHDEKKLINRGFLIGPICPIYGVGCLLMIFLLRSYLDDPIVLLVMAILLCSFLEYFTGYLMEKLFKARWWDYSHKKFNINGRICLDNLVAFGLLGLVVMYVLNPFFIGILNKVNSLFLICVAIFLFLVMVVDLLVSFKIISGFRNVTNSLKKDNTEEITRKVRELLFERGGLYKRLVSAFDFEASERYLREKIDKVKDGASKAIEVLEIEKTRRIEHITKEYNKRINYLKGKIKK